MLIEFIISFILYYVNLNWIIIEYIKRRILWNPPLDRYLFVAKTYTIANTLYHKIIIVNYFVTVIFD